MIELFVEDGMSYADAVVDGKSLRLMIDLGSGEGVSYSRHPVGCLVAASTRQEKIPLMLAVVAVEESRAQVLADPVTGVTR